MSLLKPYVHCNLPQTTFFMDVDMAQGKNSPVVTISDEIKNLLLSIYVDVCQALAVSIKGDVNKGLTKYPVKITTLGKMYLGH